MLEKNRTEAATTIDRDFMIVLALDRHLRLMRQCEPTRNVRHCPHVSPTTEPEARRLSAGFEIADSIVCNGDALCKLAAALSHRRPKGLTCDGQARYPFAR